MTDTHTPQIYFVGDNHIGDKIMLKYRPYFKTMKDHNNATWGLLDQVTAEDVVCFMGDNFLTPESLERLATYPFKKIQLLGNHEFEKGVTIHQLAKVMDEIHGCLKWEEFWLSHLPVHKRVLGPGMFNIHGHFHENAISMDKRYINVSMEATYFRLISLEDIRTGAYTPFQNPFEERHHGS